MVWFICYHLCLFFIITRLRAHNFEPHLVQCIYPSDDPIQPCPSRYRFNTASFFVSCRGESCSAGQHRPWVDYQCYLVGFAIDCPNTREKVKTCSGMVVSLAQATLTRGVSVGWKKFGGIDAACWTYKDKFCYRTQVWCPQIISHLHTCTCL